MMNVRAAIETGSRRIDCDCCGGHACPHAYQLRLAGVGAWEPFNVCGSCLVLMAQLLLDHQHEYAQEVAKYWWHLRAERERIRAESEAT